MLASYRTRVTQLLQSPPAPTTLYATADIDVWINSARGQVAGESESIRIIGTIPAVVGQRNYSFSSIDIGVSATTGAAGPINVRRINYGMDGWQKYLRVQAWEYFDLFFLNNPVPVNGEPMHWARYSQGVNGSFYVDPPPGALYTFYCDCVCFPIDLVNDTTVEAIPYLWTDAVPYLAAYFALLSAQNAQRQQDADRMFVRYTEFMERARTYANPSVNRHIYAQSPDLVIMNKIGQQQQQRGQG